MRLVLLQLFFLAGGLIFAQDSLVVQSSIDSNTLVLDSTISRIDSVVSVALEFKGVPYRYGGNNMYGVDCSGLVCLAYESVNIDLPRSSSQLALQGQAIIADSLKQGDLIFFKGRSNNHVGHVALVSKIIDGALYIIHATSSGGVIEENLYENAYFMKRWLFNRRID